MQLLKKRSGLKKKGSKDFNVDEKDWLPKKLNRSGSSLLKPSSSMLSTSSSFSFSKKHDGPTSIVDFTISIEALDGIIATNTGGKFVNIGQMGVPVFGVVSYNQRVVGSKSVIQSNVPSMPLVKSNSSFGNRDRFHAGFSNPLSSPGEAESAKIEIALPMRKNTRAASGFYGREMEMTFSLMRGSEVMKLGMISLPLSGDESGHSKLIAISNEKTVKTTRIVGNKRISQKSRSTLNSSSISFINDPSRRYSLQRANLRISVVANERINESEGATAQYMNKTSVSKSSSSHGDSRPPRPSTARGERKKIPENLRPVCDLVSIDAESQRVSIVSGKDNDHEEIEIMRLQSKTKSTDDDSLLEDNYTMSQDTLSRASTNLSGDSFEDKEFMNRSTSYLMSTSGFASVEPDDTISPIGSTNSDLSQDDTAFIDDVSLGTIQKFKEIGNMVGSLYVEPKRQSSSSKRSSSSPKKPESLSKPSKSPSRSSRKPSQSPQKPQSILKSSKSSSRRKKSYDAYEL